MFVPPALADSQLELSFMIHFHEQMALPVGFVAFAVVIWIFIQLMSG